ncbi:MAG: hydroxyphenylacetyl-CoA thioesterase PaaI [Nitratireductor sp.]|nr:hydroxyphenylacetyl-CoA thioesterase PaaI [Nitratireductor sp.]
MTLTAQQRAQKSAEAMWANDRASKGMGMAIDAVGPGTATLSMTVERHHTNGHDICHGGFIFTLADSAFAFACNAYNQVTVAQHCTINFLAPGRLGDRLTAHAREIRRAGRSGIYDITVTDQDGKAIAEFRGMSRTVQGTLFEEEEA